MAGVDVLIIGAVRRGWRRPHQRAARARRCDCLRRPTTPVGSSGGTCPRAGRPATSSGCTHRWQRYQQLRSAVDTDSALTLDVGAHVWAIERRDDGLRVNVVRGDVDGTGRHRESITARALRPGHRGARSGSSRAWLDAARRGHRRRRSGHGQGRTHRHRRAGGNRRSRTIPVARHRVAAAGRIDGGGRVRGGGVPSSVPGNGSPHPGNCVPPQAKWQSSLGTSALTCAAGFVPARLGRGRDQRHRPRRVGHRRQARRPVATARWHRTHRAMRRGVPGTRLHPPVGTGHRRGLRARPPPLAS